MDLHSLLLFIGIFIMIYGLYKGILVYRILSNKRAWFSFGKKFKKPWLILIILITFFLAGYFVYLMHSLKIFKISIDLLVALIFFFGAIFVLIMTSLNYKIYKNLIK